MSRPRSPHAGDLDAVLRDDLALEQIGRGRRPRGSDDTLKLLCAIAEDVEVKVPRRRSRRGRVTRGLLATTVAATVLGATGVAAAEPGDSGNLALSTPRPGNHVQAAERSLTEAQKMLRRGNEEAATEHLNRADAQLRRAGSSTHSTALARQSNDLREQTGPDPRPLPTTPATAPTWSWSWGIPGGGPGWQPDKPPYQKDRQCLLVVCRSTNTQPSVPQQTPGTSSSQEDRPGLLFRNSRTATPTSPDPRHPSPSSPSSPSAEPTAPTPPSPPLPTATDDSDTDDSQPSPSGDGGRPSSPEQTAQPRPSSSPNG